VVVAVVLLEQHLDHTMVVQVVVQETTIQLELEMLEVIHPLKVTQVRKEVKTLPLVEVVAQRLQELVLALTTQALVEQVLLFTILLIFQLGYR
jgi:hypothetical protein